MKYIAIEEAFSLPQSKTRFSPQIRIPTAPAYAAKYVEGLADIDGKRLDEMDQNGIDIQVLSLTVPGVQAERDLVTAIDHARAANDYLADAISRHPSRFRGFAAVPLQDPDAAIDELYRTVKDLGFCGVLVNDHTNGRYLDHPDFDGFWSELESLGVPLYLHPGSAPYDHWGIINDAPALYGATWSWQAETGGHALRVLYSGLFDRHPEAKMILGHMGEFLPFQKSRFDARYRTLELDEKLRLMPSEYFGRNIMFTTTGIHDPRAIEAAVLVSDPESILFGVDYPFESSAEAVGSIEQARISYDVKAKIAYQNAERILGI